MEESTTVGWYAIRTFNCKELVLSDFLKEKGIDHFVPMTYVVKPTKDKSRPVRTLAPVVHNYVFVRRPENDKEFIELLNGTHLEYYILRKIDSRDYYEISDSEMNDFRLLCDPSFKDSVFMDRSEAEAKPGKEVIVVHGPFKGLRGKLHRVKNQFFFVKTLASIGVMIRISRWYCKVVD